MGSSWHFGRLERTVIHDQRLAFTLTSYALCLIIYANLSFLDATALGIMASILFFLINGIFLGHAFFARETTLFRLMLGLLLLVILLGLVGLLVMLAYNLDITRSTLVLFIVTTLSSLSNKKVKATSAD